MAWIEIKLRDGSAVLLNTRQITQVWPLSAGQPEGLATCIELEDTTRIYTAEPYESIKARLMGAPPNASQS